MATEFVVHIKTTDQISPDDFVVATKTLKVTDETTIGEINTWVKQYHSYGYSRFEVNELEYIIAPKNNDTVLDDLPY